MDLAYWRKMDAWDHTAEILALLASTSLHSTFTADQFHPLRHTRARELAAPKDSVSFLEMSGL